MSYGTIKVDTITFTDNSVDKSVSLSGLIQNPTFTGNITVTGTISGDVIRGGTTVSGATVTGTTANFVSGVFTTQISGATVTGTTASFTSGVFTNISGTTATITSGIIASGTDAAPSLAILADLDTGLFSPGANQLAVATNGTGRLFIDATGNVGVGAAASANGVLRLNVSSGNNANLVFSENSTDRYLLGQVTGDNALRVYDLVAVSERLRITSAGLVGIGAASPIFLTDILSGTPNTGANVNNPSQLSVTGPNKTLIGGGATFFVNSNSDFAIDNGGSIALSGRNTTSSTNSVVWGVVKGAKENATSTNTAGYLAFCFTKP